MAVLEKMPTLIHKSKVQAYRCHVFFIAGSHAFGECM